MQAPDSSAPFKLALVLAGAVSAGAYQAGVVDGLLHALDEWTSAKRRGADVPNHDVRIDVLSGASAGGMTASMIASVARRKLAPVPDPSIAGSTDNVLHLAWVDRIDITGLLGTGDLAGDLAGGAITSLLDCSALDAIAEDVFTGGTPRERRPYFAEGMKLLLAVSNLRGVPYFIPFGAAESDGPIRRDGHGMLLHRDHLGFRVDPAAGAPPDAVYANDLPADDMAHGNWHLVRLAALASGAFPVALRARVVGRDADEYRKRLFALPGTGEDGRCVIPATIKPDWPFTNDRTVLFTAVDGGIADNEPLELARETLVGVGGRNRRGCGDADSAVLMIDPFPEPPQFDAEGLGAEPTLVGVMQRLLRVLLNQSRFKLDELRLASGGVHSRFLIAPTRDKLPPMPGVDIKPHSACSPLASFGGFLHRRFREHDYALGRHNVRSFLMKYFALCESNPLFAGMDEGQRNRWAVGRTPAGDRLLPIIPVMDEIAMHNATEPAWPTLGAAEGQNLLRLDGMLATRLNAVLPRLIDDIPGFWTRQALRLGWRAKRGELAAALRTKVEVELTRHALIEPRIDRAVDGVEHLA